MTNSDQPQTLEPVHAGDEEGDGRQWSRRLVLFLRAMAALSLGKGLYHWAIVCGIGAPFPSGFDSYASPYQAATVFFAVIDPVAGVGLGSASMNRQRYQPEARLTMRPDLILPSGRVCL